MALAACAVWLAPRAARAEADACPVFLPGSDVALPGQALARRELRAFRLTREGTQARWQAIPLAVDPLDEDGHLLFPTDVGEWGRRPLAPGDRLALEPRDFGEARRSGEAWPCAARDATEVALADGRYAYVLACPDQALAEGPVLEGFSHDARRHYMRSPAYTYRYAPKNHLMFDAVALRPAHGIGETVVSEDSDQLIHVDVKSFFTLRFDADDIQAEIQRERRTPLGWLAQLRFFLRVLFFRVDLELKPEAHFFRNSVFIPMVMTVPLDAAKHVNFGSGIYYTWKPRPAVRWDYDPKTIPLLDGPVAAMDSEALVRKGLAFCAGDRCLYRLRGEAEGVPVEMAFALRRTLVEKGFFPMAIRDTTVYEAAWGRKVSRFAGTRTGVYFECSRLAQGSHEWEFWLKSADKGGTALGDCPRAATVRRVAR